MLETVGDIKLQSFSSYVSLWIVIFDGMKMKFVTYYVMELIFISVGDFF